MPSLKFILYLLLFSVTTIIIFNLLKVFLLNKVKVNKWIIFVAALIVLFVPVFFNRNMTFGSLASTIQSGIFVILLLWFLDINGFTKKPKDNDKIVIRPKAKPNRLKHKQ